MVGRAKLRGPRNPLQTPGGGLSGEARERHLIALAFELSPGPLGVNVVKMRRAEILVRRPVTHPVIQAPQQGMGDGHNYPLLAKAPLQRRERGR